MTLPGLSQGNPKLLRQMPISSQNLLRRDIRKTFIGRLRASPVAPAAWRWMNEGDAMRCARPGQKALRMAAATKCDRFNTLSEGKMGGGRIGAQHSVRQSENAGHDDQRQRFGDDVRYVFQKDRKLVKAERFVLAAKKNAEAVFGVPKLADGLSPLFEGIVFNRH